MKTAVPVWIVGSRSFASLSEARAAAGAMSSLNGNEEVEILAGSVPLHSLTHVENVRGNRSPRSAGWPSVSHTD